MIVSYLTPLIRMSFKSLNHILGVLQEQSRWQDQPFQHLCKCWPEIVGAAVAGHTRPLSIGRSTLWVATSSAAWAQNLTFERQRILEKLNQRLPSPLVDIRFSTAQWQSKSSPASASQAQTQLRQHPSWLVDTPSRNDQRPVQNPNTAFQHWAKVMQARTHGLPLCPQCNCPTPPGELQRWAVCSICAVKKW